MGWEDQEGPRRWVGMGWGADISVTKCSPAGCWGCRKPGAYKAAALGLKVSLNIYTPHTGFQQSGCFWWGHMTLFKGFPLLPPCSRKARDPRAGESQGATAASVQSCRRPCGPLAWPACH